MSCPNPRKSGRRISAFSTDHESSLLEQNQSQKRCRRREAHNESFSAAREITTGVDKVGALAEGSGRERLKKHREEVAGRVSIPDKWGQEGLLKDWIDYSTFDVVLIPNGIVSAREALVSGMKSKFMD